MLNGALRTTEFDPIHATEAEYVALNKFQNRIRAERWPEDPSRPLEETVSRLQVIPSFWGLRMWVVWRADESEIVATAEAYILQMETNQHLVELDMAVLPEMRRRGIAKRLLSLVAKAAWAENRRLLLTETDADVPAGEAFMQRLGAQTGLVERINQLDLADLDRDLIDEWQQRAQERAGDFELGLWEGPYPEAEVEAIADLKEVMNTAPRGDLDMEDFTWTVDDLRESEASLAQRGVERWTMYARHRPTGEFAGYTEVFWNPHEPETLYQGDTGVFPKYRNRGLGRWVKAAMLDKVLRDRPQVKRVRTGNADSNGPMLCINYQLGFKPHKAFTVWQIELERVSAYLAESSEVKVLA